MAGVAPAILLASRTYSISRLDPTMSQAFFPIEAVSGLWEIVCFGVTLFAVATAWALAPR